MLPAVSGEPERVLAVLVAPPGPLAGIRETLQDWSAAGLVGSYLWMECCDGSGRQDRGLLVEDGDVTPTGVEDVLATRRMDRIRICMLVPVLSDGTVSDGVVSDGTTSLIGPDEEDRLAARITLARGPAKVERLRCIVTRHGAVLDPGDRGSADRNRGDDVSDSLAREGWHNVVIAPEDAAGPGLGMKILTATDDALAIGPPAAAVLAGLTGLWAGIKTAPLDDQSILPGRTVRVARGYFRRLDASAVQTAVRRGVFATDAGLPRPRTGSGRAVTIEDVDSATAAMAQQLWTKHQSVLRGPRVQPPAVTATKIGPLQAIRMLFGFIGATVRNAPMTWYRTMLNRVASKTASAVQSGVFGRTPSSYEVVVRGVRPDGTPADWRELAAATGQLEEALVEAGQLSQPTRPDLSALWQDYVAAALTLADAGDRGTRAGLPPIMVGTDLGVVRRAADIVPGPQSRLDLDGSPSAGSDEGRTGLHPVDVLGSYTREQQLSEAGDLGGDRKLSRLRQWTARWQHTFGHRVGARLGKAVLDTEHEVRSLVEALTQAADLSEIEEDTRRRQRKLAKLMRIFLIIFGGLEVVLFGLRWLKLIDWSVVAFAGVGVLIAWLIASFVVFVRNQQALFAELNRRREIGSQAEANRQNLAYATRDLRRLTEAYDQFLAWSRVIGVVLTEPFGPDAAGERLAPVDTGGLPLSVRVGEAEEESAVVAEAVEQARRRIFGAGWLTANPNAPWLRALSDAPARLGPRAMDLRDEPQRMFTENTDPESLLLAWADDLERHGLGAAGADWYWSRIADGLSAPELSRQLIARVVVDGRPEAWDDFAADIDRVVEGQSFHPELFDSQARVAGRHRISQNWYAEATRGLSRTAVLVQLTDGIPVFDLALVFDHRSQTQQWQPPNADSEF